MATPEKWLHITPNKFSGHLFINRILGMMDKLGLDRSKKCNGFGLNISDKIGIIERGWHHCEFATALGEFLVALQRIDVNGESVAGPHNFYRGGPLYIYDAETRQAIAILGDEIDSKAVRTVWDAALATTWEESPAWVHGDITVGNLLVDKGQLCAIIDFGCMGIGDPACDLVIAWTLFKGESRDAFRAALKLDSAT